VLGPAAGAGPRNGYVPVARRSLKNSSRPSPSTEQTPCFDLSAPIGDLRPPLKRAVDAPKSRMVEGSRPHQGRGLFAGRIGGRRIFLRPCGPPACRNKINVLNLPSAGRPARADRGTASSPPRVPKCPRHSLVSGPVSAEGDDPRKVSSFPFRRASCVSPYRHSREPRPPSIIFSFLDPAPGDVGSRSHVGGSFSGQSLRRSRPIADSSPLTAH